MTKCRERELAEVLRRRVRVGGNEHLAALVDDDVFGILRDRDRRLHLVAVERHDLAGREFLLKAPARV